MIANTQDKKTASMLEKKQGYLDTKSSKTLFARWQKRWFVLVKGKLLVFNSDQDYLNSLLDKNKCNKKYQPSQVIKMSAVNSVCFHYDRNAPRKSKKLFKEGEKLD